MFFLTEYGFTVYNVTKFQYALGTNQQNHYATVQSEF